MKPELEDRIDALLAQGHVHDALAVISGFPDLRHTELPPLSKPTIARLSGDGTSVATLVEALASTSPSVRRFAKKYAPKLDGAGELLLAHLVEATNAFRPVSDEHPGLAGSFGGFASPVGREIVEAAMPLSIVEPAVYSVAARYAREALGAMVGALAAARFAFLMPLREYLERAPSSTPRAPHLFEQASDLEVETIRLQLIGAIADSLEELWWTQARKGQPDLVDAALAWVRGDAIASDVKYDGVPAVAAIRERLGAPDPKRQEIVDRMRSRASDLLRVLPKASRARLYGAIAEIQPSLAEAQGRWIKRAVDDYLKQYPGEADEATAASSDAPKSDALFGVAEPVEGPPANQLVAALESIEWALERAEASAAVAAAGIDATAVIAAARAEIEPDGKARIPEARLDEAAWAQPVFDLLVSMSKPYAAALAERRSAGPLPSPQEDYEAAQQLYFTLFSPLDSCYSAAGMLLPQTLLDRWTAFWLDEVGPYQTFHEIWRALGLVGDARGIAAIEYFRPWLVNQGSQPNGNARWQSIVARFYRRPEPDAHALVRDAIDHVPLPTGTEYYKRRDWNAPYQWVISAAWRRGDVALLAGACERCALPVYRKGERWLVPLVESIREDGDYAPQTRETDASVPVGDVWKLVASGAPDRVERILVNALAIAEFEEPARAVLVAASDATSGALEPLSGAVLELIESSEPAVACVGLAIVARNAGRFEGRESDAVAAASRWISSTSSAAAKSAVSALGALAANDGEASDAAAAALGDALFGETPAVLEHVLKTLKKIPPARVRVEAHDRIRELSDADPKRYAKLAKALGV